MKYRVIQLFVAPACLLFLSAASLSAQRSPAAPATFKTCVFPAVNLSTTDEYDEYESIITNQLLAELQNAGFIIIPQEDWERARQRQGVPLEELYQGESAIPVAGAAGAGITVVSSYSVEGGLMALDIKCYDVAQSVLITGVFQTARVNLSIYNTIAEATAKLIPKIKPLGPPPVQESPVVEEIALLSPDEGMSIFLGDEGFVGTITDGRLMLPPIPFAIGTRIDVEKRKEGYHTGEETLKLKEPEMEIELKRLHKQTRTATELNWTFGQLLGFGIAQRFYLKPDQTFLAAEHYLYVQHNFSGGKPVFHHDLRVLFGAYAFSGPDRLLRFNLSAGLGVIITYFTIPDQFMYADFYWNLLNAAVELNFNRFLLYIRSEAKYALGLGPANLLGRDWIGTIGEGGPTIFTLGIARKW